MNFFFNAPTKVYFGQIKSDDLRNEIKNYGTNVILLTGGSATQKISNDIKCLLEPFCNIHEFNGIQTNPLIEYIELIAEKNVSADVIITVGGGSVHDSGKALAVALTHKQKLEKYMTDGELSVPGIKNNVIPIITVPTIFGTGSEVSPAALLRIENKKRVMFSSFLYPRATFMDYTYIRSIPQKLCINSSLDALVQGIESLVSLKAQAFSKRFSYSAIERSLRGILLYAKGDKNDEVLQELALASIESLYAVGQSTVGAAHAISDPLSGRFNIHHGAAVGALLPYVVEVNYDYAAEAYDNVKGMIEKLLDRSFDSLVDAILEYYREIEFDIKHLREAINMTTFDITYRALIDESYNGDMVGNPRDLDDKMIGYILNKTFGVD